MKVSQFFIFALLCALCLSACKKDVEVSGEVFIVTAGAGNYKLGLVQVAAIPEDIINLYVQNKKTDEMAQAKTALEKAAQELVENNNLYEKENQNYQNLEATRETYLSSLKQVLDGEGSISSVTLASADSKTKKTRNGLKAVSVTLKVAQMQVRLNIKKQ